MDGTQRIPANIFDEMAGFQEPSEKSSIIKENINESQKEPEINKKRLKLASNFFLSKIEKKLVKGFYNVAKELIKLQKKEAPFTNIKIVENEVVSNDEEDDGFEITSGKHGDIEYLYLIDIQDKLIQCYRPDETLLQSAKYDSEIDVLKWDVFCKKGA